MHWRCYCFIIRDGCLGDVVKTTRCFTHCLVFAFIKRHEYWSYGDVMEIRSNLDHEIDSREVLKVTP